MTPPRMLSNEKEFPGSGHGLKSRVTACRKRIRLHRFHRMPVDNQPEERLPESVSAAGQVPNYITGQAAVRSPLVQALDREAQQLGAEQEVGIT